MNFLQLAELLKSGAISLPEWTAGMRELIRAEQSVAMILQRGGREYVTQADWGYVGSSVKKQYGFLDGFANDIAADPAKWKTGRLNNRVRLYEQNGYSALEDFKQRDMKNAGWTQERRRLGQADHCSGEGAVPGCIEIAGMGWRQIGSLPKIGEALCGNNCKCRFEYRRPNERGGWVVESNA